MDVTSSGVREAMDAIDATLGQISVQKRTAIERMERASACKDALSRASASLRDAKQFLGEVEAEPSTAAPPPAVGGAASGETQDAKPDDAPQTPPKRSPKRVASETKKAAKRAKAKHSARPAKVPEPEPEPVKTPALQPVVVRPAKPAKPDMRNTPVADTVLAMARKHPGQTVEVLANIVCAERGLVGTDATRRVRIAIDDLVRNGKLHKSPDGTVSA